jgi:FSR family fosmidomycin resistance protein-like MFS transporter
LKITLQRRSHPDYEVFKLLNSQSVAQPQKDQFQTGPVVSLISGHAVHDGYLAFLAPLLPLLIERIAISKTQGGFLSSLLQIPSVMQPILGYFADRYDLRWITILAPAVSAAAMSLIGIAPGYAMLVILLTVAGISTAAFHSVAPVMTGAFSGNKLGRGMSLWMVGGELGRTLGPIVVVSAVTYLTLPGLPVVMTGGLLASVVLFFRLRKVDYHPANHGQSIDIGAALKQMAPVLLPLAAMQVFRSFVAIGLPTYLPTFLTEAGASLWFAGASLSLMEAAGVAGAMSGGVISDRLGRRTVIGISIVLTSLLLFLFATTGSWLRLPLLLLLGFASLSITPVFMAVVQENFPENRALANGVFMLINFGINGVGVILVGVLGDRFGLAWTFKISAGIALLCLPFLFFLPNKGHPDLI